MFFAKLKLLLANDWSVGGTSMAAIVSPEISIKPIMEWVPWVSQEATLMLPVLGVMLLFLQIILKLINRDDED